MTIPGIHGNASVRTPLGPLGLDDLDRAADLHQRAAAVAAIAAQHAENVDRDAVFPSAAIAAAKDAGFMGLLIPRELGGLGASLTETADVCYTLGQACASTAMIVAMHQAALACVARHYQPGGWHEALLKRAAAEQLLFASSTTEGNAGGNVRSSAAPLTGDGAIIELDRDASVISYGAEAGVIVTTARRSPEAAPSDQVLAIFTRDDYTLTPSSDWDAFGMRGTASAGFRLKAKGIAAQIMPLGYDKIHPQSMVPVSHLTWAALWAGIAAGAVSRSQNFVRTAARRAGGQMPPGAPQYTKAVASLRKLRALIATNLQTFEQIDGDERALTSIDFQTSMSLLKIEASELTVETVMSAMRASGLAGYRNNGDFGLGRHLRDALSAPIMIHNDRIATNIAPATLMRGIPSSLFD
ncbi:MAG: acyl-CoA dehydrogenase family protein [Beijerinckiaceae bacterium]|jgi:acyl-CoA dehydrogenase